MGGPWPVGSARRSRPIVAQRRHDVKHFSCFYLFLGGALYQVRWQLWARIIGCAGQWVPAEAVIVLIVDDSTKKKAGRQIEGSATIATGRARRAKNIARCAGSTLSGADACPGAGWPGQHVSVPIGLSLYLKEEQADKLQLPYQTRSALAREIADFVAAQLPTRQIRVLGDGGYASKESLHQLPATVDVVSRMLITGKLYASPSACGLAPGCPPKKGPRLGSPKTPLALRLGGKCQCRLEKINLCPQTLA